MWNVQVCAGMGSAISSVHKDVYKAARLCLVDRVMGVRSAAAQCLLEMLKHSPSLHSTELESMAALCFRALDGCNYEVRCAVSKLLGTLVACTQHLPRNAGEVSISYLCLIHSKHLNKRQRSHNLGSRG